MPKKCLTRFDPEKKGKNLRSHGLGGGKIISQFVVDRPEERGSKKDSRLSLPALKLLPREEKEL